ncbi:MULTISPECIES: hypothetical protein [unclassified Blastococcus]
MRRSAAPSGRMGRMSTGRTMPRAGFGRRTPAAPAAPAGGGLGRLIGSLTGRR